MPDDKQEFNDRSIDAMFATIIVELRTLNSKCDRIEEQANKTNGRVTALERWRDVVSAKALGVSLGVSTTVSVVGWLIFRG